MEDRLQKEQFYIRQCLAGNPDCFEFLVKEYERRLFLVAHRMVGNREDASDLVQEAFIKAYYALSTYRFEFAFSTWLYRILTNLCINFCQQRRRPSLVGDTLSCDIVDVKEPISEVEKKEFWESVEQSLQKLSALERSVFLLATFEKLSVSEIMQIVERPRGTICWLLFQARKKLQTNLDKNGWRLKL